MPEKKLCDVCINHGLSNYCNPCNENNNFVPTYLESKKIENIQDKIYEEILSAIKKYPLGFHSNHEALGVILEEFEELKDEIKREKYFYARTDKQTREAIQLAAMAIRFILDIPKNKEE